MSGAERTSPLPSPAARALFDAAVDLAPAAQDAYLAESAARDPRAAAEARELLLAERAAPAFLERAAGEIELEGRAAGPWRIEGLLASGGMGDVYRARRMDADLEWTVALKVLKRGLDSEQFLARFRAERRTLAALSHPFIVGLVDAGALEDGRPWLAMERVDGAPIAQHCSSLRLALRERLRLFLDVCAAVQHAHERLVVHCDLKPANVLVTRDGKPKLLDFGIARLLGDGASAGAGPRTAGYASPEQERGEPVGVAADVFGLGALLAELLADLPRAGSDPDLAAIVAKAKAAVPEWRYATAAALADDLGRFLGGRPVAARRVGRAARAAKFARRHRAAVAGAAVAALALGFAGVLLARDVARTRDEARLGWQAHRRAVEVSAFLERLARAAGTGADGSVHDLDRALAAAAAEIEAGAAPLELPLEPEVEGRLRLALGALLLDVRRFPEAEVQLRRALQLALANRGFGKADVERAAGLLARAVEGR